MFTYKSTYLLSRHAYKNTNPSLFKIAEFVLSYFANKTYDYTLWQEGKDAKAKERSGQPCWLELGEF